MGEDGNPGTKPCGSIPAQQHPRQDLCASVSPAGNEAARTHHRSSAHNVVTPITAQGSVTSTTPPPRVALGEPSRGPRRRDPPLTSDGRAERDSTGHCPPPRASGDFPLFCLRTSPAAIEAALVPPDAAQRETCGRLSQRPQGVFTQKACRCSFSESPKTSHVLGQTPGQTTCDARGPKNTLGLKRRELRIHTTTRSSQVQGARGQKAPYVRLLTGQQERPRRGQQAAGRCWNTSGGKRNFYKCKLKKKKNTQPRGRRLQDGMRTVTKESNRYEHLTWSLKRRADLKSRKMMFCWSLGGFTMEEPDTDTVL